jgi:hypothetical protein
MLAASTKIPELELEREEATKLGDAVTDLAACYNHVIDPKVAAWIQLGIVGAAIYGPRVVAIRMREKMEANRTRVVEMKPVPPPPPP